MSQYDVLYQYPALVESLEPIAPETITVDKWFTETAQPLLLTPSYQTQFESVFFAFEHELHVTPITVDKWFTELSQPLLIEPDYQTLFQSVFETEVDLVVVPAPDFIQSDLPYQPPDVPDLTYLYPSTFFHNPNDLATIEFSFKKRDSTFTFTKRSSTFSF